VSMSSHFAVGVQVGLPRDIWWQSARLTTRSKDTAEDAGEIKGTGERETDEG